MKNIISLFLMVLSVCLYMVKEAYAKNLKITVIELDRYTSSKELSIFYLSDIHRRKLSEEWLQSLQLSVDAVMIGGDLMEKDVSFSQVEHNIKCLRKLGPVFFVYGNNDEEVDKLMLQSLLDRNHVVTLQNRAVKWHLDESTAIWIAGVGDINYEKDDLSAVYKEITDDLPVILLSHDPRILDSITSGGNQIDLVLSGHTHGGQIRVFGFGPYEKGRLLVKDNTYQLISNGYGTTLLPFRLGAKSEVHHITVKNRSLL
ncbi:metallophosphoesterase [Jeotgalibacillus soli]|uniref:Calcineurin-like phosphoesterase domain-containing protein n=1 Tax=Jeotgalibacillus soli TaxID=889306 RepID=A0A0C2VI96_9BACL|nr:metallophosphoesterase [Jeotgalibacillus soli]KIL44226.1 hypothetical protein KP78_31900 [Jeotgalibacillus soli]